MVGPAVAGPGLVPVPVPGHVDEDRNVAAPVFAMDGAHYIQGRIARIVTAIAMVIVAVAAAVAAAAVTAPMETAEKPVATPSWAHSPQASPRWEGISGPLLFWEAWW